VPCIPQPHWPRAALGPLCAPEEESRPPSPLRDPLRSRFVRIDFASVEPPRTVPEEYIFHPLVFPNTRNPNIMTDNDEPDYSIVVQNYSDDELLQKERSKRRRKTSDMVGTGLCAVAAMEAPPLWAAAGASVKSYLNSSSKHKTILKEITRRGLSPMKGDLSDTILPILTSAGSLVVGRAFGGTAGQGIASQAGNIMHSVSNKAFGGTSNSSKKDKASKKVMTNLSIHANLRNRSSRVRLKRLFLIHKRRLLCPRHNNTRHLKRSLRVQLTRPCHRRLSINTFLHLHSIPRAVMLQSIHSNSSSSSSKFGRPLFR
jgi:hypothetical protein